jgi:ribosomal protein S12 methylthiotransferase accessory factor YcaO
VTVAVWTARIALFATPRRSKEIRDTLTSVLGRTCHPWLAATEVWSYRAPRHLLGHDLVMAEVSAPGRRPVEAAACDTDTARLVTRFAGELTERLALRTFRPPVVVRDSEEKLRRSGAAVFDVAGYLGEALFPEAWPYSRYSPARVYPWTMGTGVVDGAPVMVPIPLLVSPRCPTDAWCELTSVGTAAGPCVTRATDAALRELVERDAMRVAWYRQGRPRLTPPPGAWAHLRDLDEQAGWSTRFFRLDGAGGAEVSLVHTRHCTKALFSVGSCCHPDADVGSSHALTEALQGRLYAWWSRSTGSRTETVRSFLDHIDHYCDPERIAAVDDFFSGQEREAASTGPAHAGPRSSEGAVRLVLHEAGPVVVRVLHPSRQPVEADGRAARLVGALRQPPARAMLCTAPTPFA